MNYYLSIYYFQLFLNEPTDSVKDQVYSFRYGDKVPRTIYGRIFSVLWILTGVCLIAIFTAAVTSALTVSSVDSDCKSIQGKHVSDLSGFARFNPLINRSIQDAGQFLFILLLSKTE